MQSLRLFLLIMLFNFQGPVVLFSRSELVYYITSFWACQALFSESFKFLSCLYSPKHLIFGLTSGFLNPCDSLSRWQLIYNIMPFTFCQHLFGPKNAFFWSFFIFSSAISFFWLNHAIFCSLFFQVFCPFMPLFRKFSLRKGFFSFSLYFSGHSVL